MLTLKFDSKNNILRTVTTGVIGVEDMLKHYNTIIESSSLPANLNVLINCRGTGCTTTHEEIEIFYRKVQTAMQKYNQIREAILVDRPYETAFVTLFERLVKVKNYEFKIFYSEDAAMKWLKTGL